MGINSTKLVAARADRQNSSIRDGRPRGGACSTPGQPSRAQVDGRRRHRTADTLSSGTPFDATHAPRAPRPGVGLPPAIPTWSTTKERTAMFSLDRARSGRATDGWPPRSSPAAGRAATRPAVEPGSPPAPVPPPSLSRRASERRPQGRPRWPLPLHHHKRELRRLNSRRPGVPSTATTLGTRATRRRTMTTTDWLSSVVTTSPNPGEGRFVVVARLPPGRRPPRGACALPLSPGPWD